MFPFIVLFLSVVGTQIASAQQLACRAQDKQLAISPNSLGTYDVTFARVHSGHRLELEYLALMLDCQVSTQRYECRGAKSDSPHADSKLRAHVVGREDNRHYVIKITSPLLAAGSADYTFPLHDCGERLSLPTRGLYETPSKSSCMAWFSGAFYHPDSGECREKAMSGCRNPFPWNSVEECRAALLL